MIKKIVALYGLIFILMLAVQTTTNKSVFLPVLNAQNYSSESGYGGNNYYDPYSGGNYDPYYGSYSGGYDSNYSGGNIDAYNSGYIDSFNSSYYDSYYDPYYNPYYAPSYNPANDPSNVDICYCAGGCGRIVDCGGSRLCGIDHCLGEMLDTPTPNSNGDNSDNNTTTDDYYAYWSYFLWQSTNWNYWNYGTSTNPSGTGGTGSTNPSPPSTVPKLTAISIVAKTLSYTGQFTRGTQRPITLQSTVFDCSGWVYFVLLNLDPNLANSLGTTTSSMQAYINSHGGYHSTPQVGDLAVWNGHVEFVIAYDGTYVTINGSRGDDGKSIPTSIGSNWLTLSRMGDINSGGFLGFWTIQ